MSHPILSRVPFLGPFVDERFLEHRRRSSSFAGIVAACLALVFLEYQFLWSHLWNWDLFSIIMTFLAIKLSMMIWFRMKD